ncbi:MAG: hypothetical protein K2M30_01885 [Desulfovibrionaceae bacterium]|nr:hypothetical protein [Desulfovibrionaceae bacterium]
MKNSIASSAVPNIRNIPRVSTPSSNTTTSPTPPSQNNIPRPQTTGSSIPQVGSSTGLTGLESTEGNFASSYVPPNETILAEYAFAEEVYKKNKRKYQHMLVSPAIQHLMIEGQLDDEHSEILFKP